MGRCERKIRNRRILGLALVVPFCGLSENSGGQAYGEAPAETKGAMADQGRGTYSGNVYGAAPGSTKGR